MDVLAMIGLFVLIVAVLLLITRTCLLIVTVAGRSMIPTLQAGERVLVWRFFPRTWLRKGHIVLVSRGATALSSSPFTYIKRITALGGETYTTSFQQREDGETRLQKGNTASWTPQTWHIPPGYLFVCGDNQASSVDSRVWGPLPQKQVLGAVLVRLPYKRSASFPSPTPHTFPQQGLPAGQHALDFTTRDLSGAMHSLYTYRDRVLLLLFIAANKLVRNRMPLYQEMASQFAHAGIQLLFVSEDDAQTTLALASDFQIVQPVLLAPRQQNPFFHDYGIVHTPAYCLIGADRTVLASGPIPEWLFTDVQHFTRFMISLVESFPEPSLREDGSK